MSLVDSPSFSITSTTVKSTLIPSEAYVLSLATSSSHYAASSSAPFNVIHLFDKADFRKVRDWTGHTNTITSMRSATNIGGNFRESLVSSSKDGTIKFWDDRLGSQPALQSDYAISCLQKCMTELKQFNGAMRIGSEWSYFWTSTRTSVLCCLN